MGNRLRGIEGRGSPNATGSSVQAYHTPNSLSREIDSERKPAFAGVRGTGGVLGFNSRAHREDVERIVACRIHFAEIIVLMGSWSRSRKNAPD